MSAVLEPDLRVSEFAPDAPLARVRQIQHQEDQARHAHKEQAERELEQRRALARQQADLARLVARKRLIAGHDRGGVVLRSPEELQAEQQRERQAQRDREVRLYGPGGLYGGSYGMGASGAMRSASSIHWQGRR